ncbi:MAG TPA: hypothetical protein VF476_11760 [Chitinophagaceae bacterium]
MKKFTILFILFFTAFHLGAQNVAINNDGTTAATSAMLDVKSTTKGFMMPRVTSVQRAAIASPAMGLLVFDTDTKTIWTYDGAAWKNLYTSGGGLVLPFSQSANTTTSALQITNQGTGAAVEGSSSAQFGIGMTARATGAGSWGLFAFSNGAGSQSVRSYADNGTAFYGENNNPANTNTLTDLVNKGAGITVKSQLANPASTAANMQIAGNHLGNQLKIYQTNAANTAAAVSIENSGTGSGIEVTSTTGYGIKGVTTTALGMAGVLGQNNGTAGSGVVGTSNAANTQGVYGLSQNGVAVRALGDNYRAVQATSANGTALYGSSTSGYALETNGNVKIAGGNTSPGAGKVLTSDAQGNATWQQTGATPKIAFKAAGVADAIGTTNAVISSPFVYPVRQKIEFKSLGYDFGGGYNLYSGTTNGSSSTFTVPVNGLYHFDASIFFVFATLFDYKDLEISIMLVRNGTTSELLRRGSYVSSIDNTSAAVSGDVTLLAGDKIYVAARQFNYASIPSLLVDSYEQCFFSGHLVFAF